MSSSSLRTLPPPSHLVSMRTSEAAQWLGNTCLLSQWAVQRASLRARWTEVQFWGLLFFNVVFVQTDLRTLFGFFQLEMQFQAGNLHCKVAHPHWIQYLIKYFSNERVFYYKQRKKFIFQCPKWQIHSRQERLGKKDKEKSNLKPVAIGSKVIR